MRIASKPDLQHTIPRCKIKQMQAAKITEPEINLGRALIKMIHPHYPKLPQYILRNKKLGKHTYHIETHIIMLRIMGFRIIESR